MTTHSPKRHSAEHKARMAHKAAARLTVRSGFTPISGKRTDALVLRAKMNGRTNLLPADRIRFDRIAVAMPANINRHTGKPHEHRAEIARRVRQAASA